MKRTLSSALVAAALFASSAPAVVVLAQDEESGEEIDPAAERAQTFEAAEEGAQTENIPGGLLMVAAYGIIWLLVLGYTVSLGFRQARTAAELARLREDLAAGSVGGDDDGE